jgi:molybdenum cofactor cytidylyltransferase
MSSAGVVLAAGASSRMGSMKQLADIRGVPLLQHVVAASNASRLDQVVVVLGSDADRIRGSVDLGRARVVVNLRFAEGMSTSVRAGFASLGPEVDRAVVILADQPDVDATLIDHLLDTQAASGLPAAALDFEGLLHPPVVLARELWARLDELSGDMGCRQLIRGDPGQVARLSAPRPLNHPVDIDTPEDLKRYRGSPA